MADLLTLDGSAPGPGCAYCGARYCRGECRAPAEDLALFDAPAVSRGPAPMRGQTSLLDQSDTTNAAADSRGERG